VRAGDLRTGCGTAPGGPRQGAYAEPTRAAAPFARRGRKVQALESVAACCCGLDGPARTAVAGLLTQDQPARRPVSTMTEAGLRLSAWGVQRGWPQVASERTGGPGGQVATSSQAVWP
jgi:hypothetical protein